MNALAVLLVAAVLAAAVDVAGASKPPIGKCMDARTNPPNYSDIFDEEDDIWFDENGMPTLYCWSGCCPDGFGFGYEICCDGSHEWDEFDDHDSDSSDSHEDGRGSRGGKRRHDSESHEDDSHERHHHRHHKVLKVVAFVAGLLALGMVILVVCVCILKKKARRAARVQVYTRFANINDSEKKKLPDGDISTGSLPPLKAPYIIQGMAPPSYTLPTPHPQPDAPPSYSTLSLHSAAREPQGAESPAPVLEVKPVGVEKV